VLTRLKENGHNLTSLLMTNQQLAKTEEFAKLFKNQQPISVGV
jgi:hypothetical protein